MLVMIILLMIPRRISVVCNNLNDGMFFVDSIIFLRPDRPTGPESRA